MTVYANIFNYSIYIIYALYILIYFNLWDAAPDYLRYINYFFQIFIGLTLIYFYNPFTRHRYGPVHKRIVFTAGILLLTSTTFGILNENIRGFYKQITSNVN
jgi:hypothetical protein